MPQTLYAGTSSGVYKSTDGGASWSSINTGLNIIPPPPTPTPINLRTALIPEDPGAAKTYHQMQSLFGPNQLVREVQPFTTERGEPAMFVLLITGPPKEGAPAATGPEVERSHCYDEDDPLYAPWMGCDIFRVTWVDGTYSVALVISGEVVNTVPLPLGNEMLPLTGFHGLNHDIWGQGEAYPEGDQRNAQEERTKLIKLADYNGDAHAWEFRLVQYAASGHEDTILVGYSARQRKLIIYKAIGDPNPEAPDNFFPKITECVIVRAEQQRDRDSIRAVNTSAFETTAEANLVDALREHAHPAVSLVAEDGGAIVGHIVFSPVSLGGHPELRVMGLAPMAVAPAHQRRGIGSALVRAGVERCRQPGFGAVVVLGHRAERCSST